MVLIYIILSEISKNIISPFNIYKTIYKQKILMKTSRFLNMFMVRVTGVEPACLSALDPKSSASANSATPAQVKF
jgi:hypothetical protein